MGLQKPKLLLKNRNNVHAAVINTPGSLSPNCLAWDAAALLLPSKEPEAPGRVTHCTTPASWRLSRQIVAASAAQSQ